MRRAGLLLRFAQSDGGNVATMFALTGLPLLAFTGVAIDYGMATRLQVKLQAAADATVLALCQTPLNTSSTTLQTQAGTYSNDYMGTSPAVTVDALVITTNPRKITLTTHIHAKSFYPSFTGVNAPLVTATSQCATPVPKTFEIALVLDNTGSMNESSAGQTKIAALKTAANNFVDYVYNNPAFSSQTKIAIVPFAGAVAVKDPRVSGDYTPSNTTWIDWTGKSSYHWKNINKAQATAGNSNNLASRSAIFNQLGSLYPGSASYPYYGWNWAGCLETPPYPQNVQDVAPSASNPDSLYQQYFAPDEPGPGTSNQNSYSGVTYKDTSNSKNTVTNSVWNDYIPDSNCQSQSSTAYLLAESRGCKYALATTSNIAQRSTTAIPLPTGDTGDLGQNGPNWGCSVAPMQRLLAVKTGGNKNTLENLINIMSARGSTNIHEGFMWGWRAISPNSVFADGAAYNTASTPTASAVTKVIILMTDGMDDWLNLLGNSSSTGNGALYNALGYPTDSTTGDTAGTSPNARLPSAHQTPAIEQGYSNIWSPASNSGRSAIDGLFAEACTNAKASPASVSVYTIAFSTSGDPIDSTGQSLLQNCASSGQYYLANNSTDLITAFAKIASSIGALRISQ